MRISSSTISEINERLRDLLSNYVHFGTGRQQYALCPLPTHSERTPSFSYHKTKRVWKCFGCGAGGDGLKFISLMHPGKTFVETVELACNILELPVEYEDGNGRPAQRKSREVIEDPFETLDPAILKSKVELTKYQNIKDNPLLSGISDVFSEEIVRTVIERYAITFKGEWIQFPQLDVDAKYRTGKYIKYLNDGHRCKVTKPQWAHTGITDKFKQCLTGLHLLKYFPAKQIGIVEGPSTMLFMACLSLAAEKYNISELQVFTNIIWMSTGAISGVNLNSYDVVKDLVGKRVTLYPDTGAHETWAAYIEPLKKRGVDAAISLMMEKAFSSGRISRNSDLRDYFTENAEGIKRLMCPYPPEWDLPSPVDEWRLQNMMVNLEMHFGNNDLEKCDALAHEYEQKREATGLPVNNYLAGMKSYAPNLYKYISTN